MAGQRGAFLHGCAPDLLKLVHPPDLFMCHLTPVSLIHLLFTASVLEKYLHAASL